MQEANKIKGLKPTIPGNGSPVTVTFCDCDGKATLTKKSDSEIEWKIIEKPKGEYYLLDIAILKRK